jgi:hypothetical protein
MTPVRTQYSSDDGIAGIERLLRDQFRTASEKAAETGQVAAEQLESMARLRDLIELGRRLTPQRRKRWPIVVTLVFALVATSFLFFDRMRSADVEMDVKASAVTFRLARAFRLWNVMGITAAGVSGVHDVQLPSAASGATAAVRQGEFQLVTEKAGKQPGSANLAPLELPAGAEVTLEKTDVPHQYRISFRAKDVEIRIEAKGSVALMMAGAPPARFKLAIPQSIGCRSGPDEVSLDFIPNVGSPGKLSQELPIGNLSLSRVERYTEGTQTTARHISTILSGSTYFEALGTESAIRQAEEIRVGTAVGEIRTLTLHDNDIELKFHGRVGGLGTGYEQNMRNIMPTRLEWLRAQHGLPLFWGTALYLFTMIAAAIRWWGIEL